MKRPYLDIGHHSYDCHAVAGEEEENDEHEEEVPEELGCTAHQRRSDAHSAHGVSAALSAATPHRLAQTALARLRAWQAAARPRHPWLATQTGPRSP